VTWRLAHFANLSGFGKIVLPIWIIIDFISAGIERITKHSGNGVQFTVKKIAPSA
jgi:hypothetical protein